MALDNLISLEFSEEELQKINTAIQELHNIIKTKAVNLSPEERRQYGSIADRNKIFVDKCKAFMEQDPSLLPRTIDKEEFDKDYTARGQVEEPLRKLARITEMFSDTKILLDFDNYNAAIAYYKYMKYLASENEPGSDTIYRSLKQHFSGGRVAEKEDEPKGGIVKNILPKAE
ncbi:Type I site-specific deoxyribonuclease [Candidatus Ornithobacterium hominis]|uniref:hypothetical protein n=1 Tax=Candidatus Ornithobacterium hominis TaxID=2497989 RepID=UPI0024BC22D8|nr:hypothetical protein [Candidatus Ornithobacterium hominis]CAI9429918.1 Type I site-specific deoxyribonuclease [Candidatus Ornithobacterium hominis]